MDATSRLLDALRQVVGAANLLTRDHTGSNLAPWEQDWRKRSNGHALAVVRPASTAELAQVGTEEAKIEVVSILAGVDGTLAQLVSLEARASEARTTIHSRIAAHARRLAVLEGLAGLGYQVSEQMETAWVTNGRIVLRKTAEPGYGVEIGGGADAARVQLRTVAFRGAAAAADPVRDRDAETIWCGDLEKLRSRFAAVGGDVAIEQALAVGAVPLRVIADVAEPGLEGMQSSQTGPMNQQQLKLPG